MHLAMLSRLEEENEKKIHLMKIVMGLLTCKPRKKKSFNVHDDRKLNRSTVITLNPTTIHVH